MAPRLLTSTNTRRCRGRGWDKVVARVYCDGKPRQTALSEARTAQAVTSGLRIAQTSKQKLEDQSKQEKKQIVETGWTYSAQ